MIEVENLTKYYRRTLAVDDISFHWHGFGNGFPAINLIRYLKQAVPGNGYITGIL